MKRGALYNKDGSKKMRFVMPGYDVEDENVPPNKVIFDSENLGTLSIMDQGAYTFVGDGLGQTNMVTIKTWDLDYIPLCHFWFNNSLEHIGLRRNATLRYNRIVVSTTGIGVYFEGRQLNSSTATVTLNWVAFNLRVV